MLLQNSRAGEALKVFEQVIAEPGKPLARVDALIQRLGALINLGRTAEYTLAVEEAFDCVRELAEPYPHGHLHAFAALATHHQNPLEPCVTHLVHSARALALIDEPDADAAWAWHDLAQAYSYAGFHGHALSAFERAREIGARAGISEELLASPESGCAARWRWTTTGTPTVACGYCATWPPRCTGTPARATWAGCGRAAAPGTGTRWPAGRRSASRRRWTRWRC